MIPKTIHYSWISDDPFPPLIKRCLASWKKHAPDYEIIRWDKDRFDINSLRFTQQAFEHKKWAFISDVQRLYALYEYGGIYLDSDVELVRPLDDLLDNTAFLGFQNPELLEMWVLGFEKGHPWIKRLLDYYIDRPFIMDDGAMDLKPNTLIATEISTAEFGLRLGDAHQYIAQDVRIFPQKYFSPPILLPGKLSISNESYAIHHFTGAWKSEDLQKKERRNKIINNGKNLIRFVIGNKTTEHLKNLFGRQNAPDEKNL